MLLIKAAWLRVEDKGILTIHEHIITRNYRISLTHSDNRNFVLNIKNVQETDKGGYMCQINTVPMKSQIGFLDVVFPPEILLDESSGDVLVTEGSNVSLQCKAKGYPKPVIKWKREDKKHIPLHNYLGKKYVVRNITGETLTITRVTRVHMGAYLCIAANGIPPSVSRLTRDLYSETVPPAVWIPNQLIASSMRQQVTLTCHIDAFPSSVNYWIKDSADIITDDDKYHIHQEEKEYKTHLSLVIKYMEPSDFGSYTCLAKNPLGVQEANVKIHGINDQHSIY
ncbi:lachesin-like protein [Leptotrombidium deliense]|uniref:Lachesin-like protein n=1 Tax=Leptotrombidium deliense TaxID=299467 RepID=A0A443SEN7_9ACAR|nr:lachesin-like protein [Leptotrombidium deliense]